jgi:hypothetical protein
MRKTWATRVSESDPSAGYTLIPMLAEVCTSVPLML